MTPQAPSAMSERDIFTAARGYSDPAARAAFLAEACGSDPALRDRVLRLLGADAAPDSLLDVPAVGPRAEDTGPTLAGPAPDTTADDVFPFLRPTECPGALGRLGHYEILEVLGRGGFGIVFRARDAVLDRMVAVKVLAPHLAVTSAARKRFVREARSFAAVRHDHVVHVYGVEDRPLAHLVMEFVPGETLQQRIDRTGPLDAPEALEIARQIAEGLAAAHALGLIHRDIKPANVLLERGPLPRVKLTDFGLARAADDASITQSGAVLGTPMYMSPEQAKCEHLDHRTDLFSLGSVLYTLVSGRPPFRAANTPAVLKRVADDTPRPIREIIPEAPQWLCDIVAKLHAKNPAARYQTAREVADFLARCQANPPAAPTPPARSRRRAAVAAALVLLCAGMALTEATGVTNMRGAAVRRTSSGGTSLVEANAAVGTQQPPAPAAPGAPPIKPADPDRRAAEWALTTGKWVSVHILVDGQEVATKSVDELPTVPFRLTVFNVNRNPAASDEALVVLKGLEHLTSLQLTNTKVTDAVLPHIKNSKRLHTIKLYSTNVSDEGLEHLAGLTELKLLMLSRTRVTEAGVRKLAAALPNCRIEWDGGTFGPLAPDQ